MQEPILDGAGPRAAGRSIILWGLLGLGFTAALLAHFHDRFWWPPDDGAYGYAAQRMLAGDVLNGNLQELHLGYIGFLHVAAFWLFGEDLLSLRYPLVAITLAQAGIGYWLLLPRGPAYAAVGTVALAALSLVQFLNPSPNWYAVFMAFAVIAVLSRGRPGDARRELLIGVLLAATFMMRHLSGVLLAMGAITWLLSEARADTGARPRLARAILAVMALGLAGYLWKNDSIGGVLLFGLWALALIGVAAARTRTADADTARLLGRLALGGLLAALPLLAYHFHHGSFATLYEDTVLATLHLTELDYQGQRRHWIVAVLAVQNLMNPPNPAAVASALFWLALLALPAVLGAWVAASSARDRTMPLWRPLTVVAVFFALVATPFEIPIYLTYTSGLSIVAAMWIGGRTQGGRLFFGTAALAIAAVGIVLHAAQPLDRTLGGVVEGRRVPLDATEGLPGVSLRMERQQREDYARVLAAIERAVPPGKPFLALPANPELHFMSRRPALYRYYIMATGIRDEAALAAAIEAFDRAPPPIVVHDRKDKFNTWAPLALLGHVKTRYALVESIGQFDIYLLK